MKIARRGWTSLNQLSVSPMGAPTFKRQIIPVAAAALVDTRHCHVGVVDTGYVKMTCPQLSPSGSTNSGKAPGTVLLCVLHNNFGAGSARAYLSLSASSNTI